MTPLPPGLHAMVGESATGAHCVIHQVTPDGRTISAAGHCSLEEAAGLLGLDIASLPPAGVGGWTSWVSRTYKKAKKLAKKIAKSKAFKALAAVAIKYGDQYTGGKITEALNVAKKAIKKAKEEDAAIAAMTAETTPAPSAPAPAPAPRPAPGPRAPRLARWPSSAAPTLRRRPVPVALPEPRQLGAARDLLRMLPARERGPIIRRLLGVS